MSYVFFYTSVNGLHMPQYHAGTLDELNAKFRDSITPVVRIIPLTGPEVRRAVTECLEAQLTVTNSRATGLLWNLNETIKALKGE